MYAGARRYPTVARIEKTGKHVIRDDLFGKRTACSYDFHKIYSLKNSYIWRKISALNTPKYLLQKSFLWGSLVFAVVFSMLFLLIYRPFSETVWIGFNPNKTLVPTLLFYLVSIAALAVSKALMQVYQIRHTITAGRYLLWLSGEFILIALVYLLFTTRFIESDIPFSAGLLLRTLYCVALILAIPYAIFTLIASNRSKSEEINIL